VARIAQSEGRHLFGLDPASYDLGRPGHPQRVYDVLVERCGLGPGTRVLEIGPGTGQATRKLLELGAEPVTVLEPNAALGERLESALGDRIGLMRTTLEDADLRRGVFDLAVAASSFHWVDEATGLRAIHDALRATGWVALWWTLFGAGDEPDAFMRATAPLLEGLETSPTEGRGDRPRHGLDSEARLGALRQASFADAQHELVEWDASWDARGIRALYGSFSPVLRLESSRRTALLDEIARIAQDEFGGHVSRALMTSLYTARKPS
jgi:SAM-dependent methyltransferase